MNASSSLNLQSGFLNRSTSSRDPRAAFLIEKHCSMVRGVPRQLENRQISNISSRTMENVECSVGPSRLLVSNPATISARHSFSGIGNEVQKAMTKAVVDSFGRRNDIKDLLPNSRKRVTN